MKIAVIDIDGVLNYYPQTFLDFIYDKTNIRFNKLSDAKNSFTYNKYNALKREYRCSDYKHDAMPRKYAKELLDYLREHDYLIYIITSRELYKNDMLENTIKWLNKNKLVYDFIYESKKKDFTIFEKFSNIDILIEDNVDNIVNIMKLCKAKCYNVINNDNYSLNVDCKRVMSLNEILEELK